MCMCVNVFYMNVCVCVCVCVCVALCDRNNGEVRSRWEFINRYTKQEEEGVENA